MGSKTYRAKGKKEVQMTQLPDFIARTFKDQKPLRDFVFLLGDFVLAPCSLASRGKRDSLYTETICSNYGNFEKEKSGTHLSHCHLEAGDKKALENALSKQLFRSRQPK